MTQYSLRYTLVRYEETRPGYSAQEAAASAGMTLEELQQCLEEGLVTPKRQSSGHLVFSDAEVDRLWRIHRLHSEVELDLDAIEVVMHLRDQLLDLQRETFELRRAMARREQELQEALRQLRQQLAVESDWG